MASREPLEALREALHDAIDALPQMLTPYPQSVGYCLRTKDVHAAIDALALAASAEPASTPAMDKCAIEGCPDDAIWDSVCEKHLRAAQPAPQSDPQDK